MANTFNLEAESHKEGNIAHSLLFPEWKKNVQCQENISYICHNAMVGKFIEQIYPSNMWVLYVDKWLTNKTNCLKETYIYM